MGNPLSADRYLVPGENRRVDPEAAARFRAFASRAALELGFDKVTAAIVLQDMALELLASQRPAVAHGRVREAFERSFVVHFAGGDA